jgi:chaperonin GroEL (HSP60 family)
LGWGWSEEEATETASGFEVGRKLVYESLAYPFQVLLNNMGYAPDFQNTVVADLKKGWSDTGVGPFASLGFNALSGNCEDLIEAGIIDPLKVVRMALRNSVSVAYTLLSMDAVVINMPDSRMGG